MAERIVAAVDGTAAHGAPVSWAVERAERTGAELELLYVAHGVGRTRRGVPDSATAASAHAVLDTARALALAHSRRLTGSGSDSGSGSVAAPDSEHHPQIATRWAFGHVAEELERASREADLLVVGTDRPHADGTLAEPLALRLAGSAACTVVVVPHDWPGGGSGVVVGADGKPPAEAALVFAADEAAAGGDGLTVVSAGYRANPLLTGLVPEVSLGDRRERIAEHAAQTARDAQPAVPIDSRTIEAPPDRALVEAAEGARLLVVGSRDLHGAKRLLLGSVGHDVLIEAHLPVAIVRPARSEVVEPL